MNIKWVVIWMALVWVFMALIMSSCATMEPDYTIFLKEEATHLKNLKDEDCDRSGYQIRKQEDGSYRLIEYFSNCDVREYRLLKEREHKQWIMPKQEKRDPYAK
jgi:hypothetical protein